MITYKKGDLVEAAKKGEVDVLAHCANCFNTMNSGIAKQIRQEFPEAYDADLASVRGSFAKLGGYTYALHPINDYKFLVIFNLYGQYVYGYDGKRYVEYDALAKCFRSLSRLVSTTEKIGMPKLGCGLAGGDWEVVEPLINLYLQDHNVIIYELEE